MTNSEDNLKTFLINETYVQGTDSGLYTESWHQKPAEIPYFTAVRFGIKFSSLYIIHFNVFRQKDLFGCSCYLCLC